MAKAPDPLRVRAQAVKKAVQEVRWVVTVDDAEHVFRLDEMTALDVAALRQEARTTARDMVLNATDEQTDALAMVVWMARRQAGEKQLRWADVAEDISVGNEIFVRRENSPEPEEEFPDPPPSGGSSGE